MIDDLDNIIGIQTAVLVIRLAVANSEFKSFRQP